MSLRQLAPWLLFIAIALIYLLFPTRVYYWDGIVFAQTIEDATSLNPSLVHPNHLIYNFVGYIFYKLLRSLGAEIRALTALQILNCLLSAAVRENLFLDSVRHVALVVSHGVSDVAVCLLSNVVEILDRRRRLYSERALPAVCFYLVLPNRKHDRCCWP